MKPTTLIPIYPVYQDQKSYTIIAKQMISTLLNQAGRFWLWYHVRTAQSIGLQYGNGEEAVSNGAYEIAGRRYIHERIQLRRPIIILLHN